MSNDHFEAAANDLQQLPGVIESVTWSDSDSIQYSGSIHDPRNRAREHNLIPVNIDGVLYADPMPVENDAGEIFPDDDPQPASVVAEADPVQTAHLIEDDGDQRPLVTTTGVESVLDFMELDGPYGWMLTEAKEAQIRLAPPKTGVSFLLSRSTNQLRRFNQE